MKTLRHIGVAAVLAAVALAAIGCDEPENKNSTTRRASAPESGTAIRVEPQPPLPAAGVPASGEAPTAVAPAPATGADALPPVVATGVTGSDGQPPIVVGSGMGPAPTAGAGETPTGLPAPVQEQAKAAHDQSARLALGEIRALLASKQFDRAQASATVAVRDYADTPAAGELVALLRQSQEGMAAQTQERATAAGAGEDQRAARHAKFLQARQAALAAMGKQDYATAVGSFQAALQEEDDPDTRAMFQQASNLSGKPRLAVAEFAVAGDVGIPDAGKIVPELMLGRFDAQRFQLVDRSRLAAAMGEQKLSPAQIEENPKVLAVKRLAGVRYVVLGTVSRLGTLAVSARLVDTTTGDIVQTADVTAADAMGLQNSLGDLAAMLQMTNEEKANYLAMKSRQADASAADDPSARVAAEAQRQAELEAAWQRIAAEQAQAFQATQHQRDAQGALADIQGLLARGDFAGALQVGTWAQGAFGDTPLADQFAGLLTLAGARQQEQIDRQADAEAWARYRAECALHHERYLVFRQRGMDALALNDVPTAAENFQAALNEEDDPNLRALLDQISWRTRRPAIAVADFDVRGDVGLPRRYAGAMLADALLRQFSPDDPRFRPLGRDELLAELGRAGLTMDDLMRTPVQPRLRRIGVRYVIVGTARPGSIVMSATLVDLAEGRAISSADIAAANRYALPRAMNDLASMLLMSPADRRVYVGNLAWSGWLARGDAAAAAGQWEEALAAYRNAAAIRNTQDLTDKINAAARNLREGGLVRRNYEAAMAAGAAAARNGDWGRAADAYQNALSFLNTPEARAAFENARGHLLQDAQQRHRLYQQAMAAGEAAAKAGDWTRALAAFQQAAEWEDTPAARNAIATARQKIADAQQARRHDYLAAMAAARAAIQAGDWGKALEAYMVAAKTENTREAMAGIATARARLAEQESIRRQYEAAMAQGRAAAQAGDWAKALDAYTRAWQVQNTRDAGAGIATAKAKLAEAQNRKLYEAAMAEAEKFARAGRWADALQAYQKAYALEKTREAQAGIAAANKALSEARNAQALYDRAMGAGAAAARAGDWARALAAYQNAAAINNTPEAQAGIVNAKKHLVEVTAGAEKKHEYDRLMQAGDAAGAAGKWQEALVAYQQAAAIDNNRVVQGKITNARKQIEELASVGNKQKVYARFMKGGDAAAAAGDWAKALDEYQRAARLDNTPEAQAGIANAKKHLAEASAEEKNKAEYNRLMQVGDAAAAANKWQEALAAYEQAAALQNTRAAQAKIATAKKHLLEGSADEKNKAEYNRLIQVGDAAAAANKWQEALTAYEQAAALQNTRAVQAKIATAKKHLLEASADEKNKAEYNRLIQVGDAAGAANKWQEALKAYEQAAALDNTRAVQAKIAAAKKHLLEASANEKAHHEYKRFMKAGSAAGAAGKWQEALTAYTQAAGIENTPEAQAGIANAKAKLAEASANAGARKQYLEALAAAKAATAAKDWPTAIAAWQKVQGIENTREAQDGLAKAVNGAYAQSMTDAKAAVRAKQWQTALDAFTAANNFKSTDEAKAGIAAMKKKLGQ